MATTKVESNIKKGFDTVKETTNKLNTNAVNFADTLVDETIATGQDWQNVMAKALKTGTTLLGKQQDFVLDTLEAVKGQYLTGTKRFGNLFSLNFSQKEAKEAITTKVEEVAEIVTKEVKTTVAKATTATKKTATPKTVAKKTASKKVAAPKATVVKAAVASKATPVAKVVTTKKAAPKKVIANKAAVIKKTVAPKAAPVAKVATTKKATPKKVTTTKTATKNDLKVIDGIGPKLASILNEGGIKTFNDLATTDVDKVKEILLAAGPRYKMHDPTTWAAQATLAAAGKMEELETFQKDLKAEKTA